MAAKYFKTLFGNASTPKIPEYKHPALGELRLNEDGEYWEVAIECHGDSFSFAIGGEETPDAALLQHALDILGNYPKFKQMLTSFLSSEKERFGTFEFEDEIRNLRLEQVCLFWPEKPENGMIYFEGPDEVRVWRCDYIERQPKGLGFDS